MSRIFVPALEADHWRPLLAEPEKQWRTGYSARTLAYAWQEADGFPDEVSAALATSEELAGAELLLALPEHQVPIPGGTRPSQNDVWALARAKGKLVSIAVEGKVAEPFGPTVGEWLMRPSPGKQTRLDFLRTELGLFDPLPSEIRYQLLHRTASGLIEAKRFGAGHALMVVHSFSPHDQWFGDYARFVSLFGADAVVGRVSSVKDRKGIQLHFAWVQGNQRYLQS